MCQSDHPLRHRPSFSLIAAKRVIRRLPSQHGLAQHLAQSHPVLDPDVHALPARRRMRMRRIPGEEHPPLARATSASLGAWSRVATRRQIPLGSGSNSMKPCDDTCSWTPSFLSLPVAESLQSAVMNEVGYSPPSKGMPTASRMVLLIPSAATTYFAVTVVFMPVAGECTCSWTLSPLSKTLVTSAARYTTPPNASNFSVNAASVSTWASVIIMGYLALSVEKSRSTRMLFLSLRVHLVSLTPRWMILLVTPMSSRTSSVRECMTVARLVVEGEAAASRTMALTPFLRRVLAVARPVGPAPMIATSTEEGIDAMM
ncbi:hypothetical protein VP1G_10724 [Cytospora mali]|uniref:Uncharacterized protein n=1 Tax=Cytospora mali TaxID=578113 RepID=A0A194UTY8_CYTMA|nr:hypothetical protein VP1G_10724 [Valsa mali var. pyri (nom. inval.)]